MRDLGGRARQVKRRTAGNDPQQQCMSADPACLAVAARCAQLAAPPRGCAARPAASGSHVSGAGLHVGHPLGYIASDIYARFKRHQGFNVLHPMGYDAYGLPAEQYAIQTGQHPAITTEENIKTYRRQLDQIGFSFDWSREVRTSDPSYYKWTQWIFIQLFESWYNKDSNKAEHIDTLIEKFNADGNANVNAVCDDNIEAFSLNDWASFSSEKKQKILLK